MKINEIKLIGGISLNALYALRFFASVAIYIHHLYYPYGFGAICVTFFFIMSGFTMAYSLNKKDFILSRKTLKQFYLNKIVKFYPLYLVTFFASIPIMHFLNVKFNFLNVIVNLSLLQSYYPNNNEVFMFNGLSWFVADIMFFYLVTPFIFILLKKLKIHKNIKIMVLITFLLYLVAFYISYRFSWKVEAYSFGWWLVYISPFFRIFDYLIGFLLGLIFIRIKDYNLKVVKFDFVFTILEVLAIIFILLSYKSKYLLIDSLRYGVYYIPALALMIFIFAFGRGIISKMISLRVFVYLGKLSYVIYMIHQLVIYYTSMYFGNTMYYNEAMTLQNYMSQIFLFIIILCISDVVNRYFIPFTNKILLIKKIEEKKE